MNRRHLIVASPLVCLTGPAAAALSSTPAQTAGPFYPRELPLDHDNDLVQVEGAGGRARGTVLHLDGRVRWPDGRPAEGCLVEIWQCDVNGRYHHPGDRRGVPRDPGFQGYGRTRCAPDGGYRFRTIRPVAYPGRTPHIHFAVRGPDREPLLVTQMYVRGEPGNNDDFLYRRLPEARRDQLSVALQPRLEAEAELAGRFDIVLGG